MPSIKARLPWVDATRALCVLAVVLLHFQSFVLGPTLDEYPQEMLGWSAIAEVLSAFRMPALFAISGFLVARQVRHGWGDRRNALRAASSMYLYTVWWAVLSISLAIYLASSEYLLYFFTEFFLANSVLWFVFFLAINVVVLTTLHRVHPAIVMGALAGLSALILAFPPEGNWGYLLSGAYNMLFFAMGVYFRPQMIRFVASGLWWKIPTAVIAVIVLTEGASSAAFRSTGWIGLNMMRETAAVFCAISITAALCLAKPVSIALSYIGRRTLIIYVLHVPLLLLTMAVRNVVAGDTIDHPLAWQVGPAVGAAVIVAACLVVGNLLRRSAVGRAFLEMPPRIRELILGTGNARTKTIDLEVALTKLPGVESVSSTEGNAVVVLTPEITDSQLQQLADVIRALDAGELAIDVKSEGSLPIRLATVGPDLVPHSVAGEDALSLRTRVIAQWN